MNDRRKDNLTDVASQISNQPQQPQSNSGNTQPQNLADNQVIGNDGTIIDLGNPAQNTTNK